MTSADIAALIERLKARIARTAKRAEALDRFYGPASRKTADADLDELLAATLAAQQAEIERLRAEIGHRKSREEHFAGVLGVADGGQYRVDWDVHLERLIANAASHESALAARDETIRGLTEWRSIETAPKDGSWFWAFYPGRLPADSQRVCGWSSPSAAKDGFKEDGYWMDAADSENGEPTHWRPLPEPPVRAAIEQSKEGGV